MTDQHRATPEQWEHQDHWTGEHRSTASCILELRARVEALEAAQLEQAESHRFCTDAIVRRVEALELAHRIQSGTLTSAERAELGVVPAVDLEAAVHRAAADQVVPEADIADKEEWNGQSAWQQAEQRVRFRLLALATELDPTP